MSKINKALEIIHSAKSKGIKIVIDQGKLAIRKEKNVKVSSDLINLIKEYRAELVNFLNQSIHSAKTTSISKIGKVKKAKDYPISNAQHRLWLVSQTEQGSAAYNIPSKVHLNNTLDVTLFSKAVHAVIERHEILRTVFRLNDNGEVRQVVLDSDELNFSIDIVDFRGSENAGKNCDALIDADMQKTFDLVNGPLLRAKLIRLSDDHNVFYYNMHHIVSDAWSKRILAESTMKFYEAFVVNKKPAIPALNIQYKDYAVWQKNQLKSGAYDSHKEYWLSQFTEPTTFIDLPVYKRRPQLKTYNGRELGLHLSPEATNKLKKMAIDKGGSVFMGLLSVLKILIYRYTGEKDVTIGNPVAGREHPDLQNQIGFFINVVALRDQINPDFNFIQTFAAVKENTLNAYKFQMYPFGNLLEDLKLIRDASRSPLFDIDMDYQVVPDNGFKQDLAKGVIDRGVTMAKYDIEFDPIEYPEGIYLQVRFNTDIYSSEMMEQFLNHYSNLLNALVANPTQCISDIDFLAVSEKTKLLSEYNQVKIQAPKDQTFIDLFLEKVYDTPDAIALAFQNRKLTYKELDEQSNLLANYLLNEKQMQSGDCVGIHLDIDIEYIVSILGILKAGGAYVSIDTSYPGSRKKQIITNAAIDIIITDTKYLFEIDFHEGDLLAIDVELVEEESAKKPVNRALADDLAYVLFTSGSTGTPKGVMITHRNLNDYLYGLINELNLDKEPYACGLMSTPSADLGNTVLFGALATGGALHLFTREMVMDVFRLHTYFAEEKIDIIKIVPSHWYSLCSGEKVLMPRKAIVFGGEKLDNKVLEIIKQQKVDTEIYNHYGPTETTIGKLIHKVNLDYPYTNVPIGKPFSETSIYVLDKRMQLLPIGAPGELYISGTGVAKGYLQQAEMTAERFIDNPFRTGEKMYKTGDVVRWTFDGNIEFIGRADNQVKIRGHRVEIKEIESVLNTFANINQSLVIAKADNQGVVQLAAYLVSDSEINTEEVQKKLGFNLPNYMVPQFYTQLEKIPLTSNGKIDFKALPVIIANANEKAYVAPATTEETLLVEAWKLMLNKEKISIKDNFYEQGGDSLKSIQIFIHLKKKGYQLPVTDIIEHPVLEIMATKMKALNVDDKQKNIATLLPLQNTEKISVEVSENQKYFIRRPWASVPSRILSITNFSEETFAQNMRSYLSAYSSLLTVFEKENNSERIIQKRIAAETLQLDIKWVKDADLSDITQLELQSKAFLERPFDYFNNDPLIRFFVVIDPNNRGNAFFTFCIAHALIDIDSFSIISDNIAQFLEQPKIKRPSFSNADFAIWQKQFLASAQGTQQRKWWTDYLSDLKVSGIPNVTTPKPIEYISQIYTITGSDFENLTDTINDLQLPFSALFLAAHQILISKVQKGNFLQKVAINGRMQNEIEENISNVLGLTTNFLPLRVMENNSATLSDYITEVYKKYLQAIAHQNIPYEIIRKDLLAENHVDIDFKFKGYFNFRMKNRQLTENSTTNQVKISYKKQNPKNNYGLGLICDLFENGITLRLLCPLEWYDEMPENLNIEHFVEKNILGTKSSLSSF